MSKIDAELPRRLLAGLQIGPEWQSEIATGVNGWEKRNGRWAVARWRAAGSMAAYTEAAREEFRGMFVVARGRLRAFRVRDPLDWMAIDQPLAPEIGTTDAVQLAKTYTFPSSSETYAIPVRAPAATSVVKVDGVAVDGTLDPMTGLFTPDENWAAGTYTWTGAFWHWMRFDKDWGSLNAPASNVQTADIELIEVR